jgi:CRP/FNR family transcriptional regulator, cyclic AMP receptor protein
MSSSFLWQYFFRPESEEEILTLLQRVPLFDELSRRERKAIEGILHRREYKQGEYIFHEDEIGLGMYIIQSGEVAIVIEKDNHEIAQLSDGEFFGEISLFLDTPRTAAAIAMTETKVFGFFEPDLFGLLETHPKIGLSVIMKLAKILAQRLHNASIENKHLHVKIAALKEKYG